jgi:hypothetical protein
MLRRSNILTAAALALCCALAPAAAADPFTESELKLGIGQDCSGADATNLDRDSDGFPRPHECNDANAALRPGARLQLSFTRSGDVGRDLRFRIRPRALPDVRVVCRPPSGRPRAC